jgi:hypothetical protein
MQRLNIAIAVMLLALFVCVSARAQQCFEYGPTITLSGTLRSRVFAGPPNYESIKRGDRKETAVMLTLTAPIWVTGEDPMGILGPSETNIREVQLVVSQTAHWKTVRRLLRKRASVTGTLFHAHTGHHRTKVLIEVTGIRD